MKKILLLILFLLVMVIGYANRPRLSFFCELHEKEFIELFSDSILIKELVEMKVSLRIGLLDLSGERALTIQRLNQAGIPLFAWLLLPEEDGYWFNMNNGELAGKRYDDFRKWSADNNLKWEGIGIDLEPDMNDAKLAMIHPWKLAWKVYKRLYDNKSLEKGSAVYQDLITRMKADGNAVESYLIPFIYEERDKKTTSLQKLAGIIDIKTDTEIPMLYTSAMKNPGIIPKYHQKNMPLALGSTGGGVKFEGFELAALSWEDLERDLLIASNLTDEIIIFCLESSVEKGFLSGIKTIDFNQQASDITAEIEKQRKMSSTVRTVVGVLDHPFWFTFAVIAVISFIIFGIYKLFALIFRLISKKKP